MKLAFLIAAILTVLGARVAPAVQPLMTAVKEQSLRGLFPEVSDDSVRQIFEDPALLLYTEAEMPRAYQFWRGDNMSGIHSPSYNIAGDERGKVDTYGNGNVEFPWGTPAGLHRSRNFSAFRFVQLPRDGGGRLLPVVYYWRSVRGEAQHMFWIFPVGATVGELLAITGPDGRPYPFEVRLRHRKAGFWDIDVLRPFPKATDLAARIKELRPDWEQRPQLARVVKHLEEPRELPIRNLVDSQPGKPIFRQSMGVDELPPLDDDKLVAELLVHTVFNTAALGPYEGWRKGTFAPTTKAPFHIVPADYDMGFVAGDQQSCFRCHQTTNTSVDVFHRGRDWYGHVRGNDGIFSFHPFDPSCISDNGFGRGVRLRQQLVAAGYVAKYDPSAHPNSLYNVLPDLEN